MGLTGEGVDHAREDEDRGSQQHTESMQDVGEMMPTLSNSGTRHPSTFLHFLLLRRVSWLTPAKHPWSLP